MIRFIFSPFVFLFFFQTLYAQVVKVKPEFEQQAIILGKKYKDAKCIYTQAKVSYTFDFDVKEKKVTAIEKSQSDFLVTKENTTYNNIIFYDDETKIEAIKARVMNTSIHIYDLFPRYYKYESNGVFYSDAKLCSFDFEFLKIGQLFTLETETKCTDVKYLCTAYFHEDQPVEEKTISFEVPEWLEIEFKEMNFKGFDITKAVTSNPKNKSTITKYTIKSILGHKSEPNSPLRSGILPHIVILAKKYTKSGETKNLFNSASDLYAWYMSLNKKVDNKSAELKPLVSELIAGKKTDVEKVESIYYWVHEHIRYVAFENGIMGFKPEAANNVCNNKYGDCKGMANLLTEMLKIAGFDARLTWLGTDGIPYDYSIPSLIVDNHMICTLILNNKRYFLDGTETYIAFNDYANRIQGRPVMIQDGDNFILDKIPSFTYERNKEEEITTYTISGDQLFGKTKQILNGEGKTMFLRAFAEIQSDKKDEIMKRYFMQDNKNIAVQKYTNSNMENRQVPVELNFEYQINNQITKLDNEIYVDFIMDKDFQTAEMDSTRINDYEFHFKQYHTATVELIVPTGYKITHLADKLSIKRDDYTFELEYKQVGNKITYTKSIIIPNASLKQKNFKDWNSDILKLKNFYNDQIVLTKS